MVHFVVLGPRKTTKPKEFGLISGTIWVSKSHIQLLGIGKMGVTFFGIFIMIYIRIILGTIYSISFFSPMYHGFILFLIFKFFFFCLNLYFELGVSAHILKSYLKLTVSKFYKSFQNDS